MRVLFFLIGDLRQATDYHESSSMEVYVNKHTRNTCKKIGMWFSEVVCSRQCCVKGSIAEVMCCERTVTRPLRAFDEGGYNGYMFEDKTKTHKQGFAITGTALNIIQRLEEPQ